jgi:hypothetical protein
MSKLSALVLLVLVSTACGCRQAQESPPEADSRFKEQKNMEPDPLQAIQESRDPRELRQAARALAASPNPADHRALYAQLSSSAFLSRLDSEETYENEPERLAIRAVIRDLAANSSPSAKQLLVALTQAPQFISEIERAEILIEILAVVRPAPPQAVEFWNNHCRPNDGFYNTTIRALLDNGTEPALQLFEKKMSDPGFSEEDKLYWMHFRLLPRRNQVEILRSCQRLLQGPLAESLRPALVETLFDYKVDEWFAARDHEPPPPRSKASPEALQILRSIGAQALEKVSLSEEQRTVVAQTLQEIPASR